MILVYRAEIEGHGLHHQGEYVASPEQAVGDMLEFMREAGVSLVIDVTEFAVEGRPIHRPGMRTWKNITSLNDLKQGG